MQNPCRLNLNYILVIAVFTLSLFSSSPIKGGDKKFDSLITEGIKQIYNIKFNEAQSTFSKVIKDHPKHPAGYFFDAMIVWWQILLDSDIETHDDKFTSKLEFVIDFCDDILDKKPDDTDALFFKGGALGFRGRLYTLRESWFKAALDGKDALPLVKQAYSSDTKNIDVQLGFGIYNYYAAVIPQQYTFVKPFMAFFPKGDREKGIAQLSYVARSGKYAKYESKYFLATLYYSFENDYNKSIEYSKELVELFPDNPRFKSLLGRTWIKRNNYFEAAKIFTDILKKSKQNLPGFNDHAVREAYYYVGLNHRRNNQPDSARYYFEVCESLSKKIDQKNESGFLINSALYLGNALDQLELRNLAVKKYKEVLEYKDYNNSRELAKKYIKNPYGS